MIGGSDVTQGVINCAGKAGNGREGNLCPNSWLIIDIFTIISVYIGFIKGIRDLCPCNVLIRCNWAQVSAADSQTVPTVSTRVSKALCCRLTLTFSLTSENLSLCTTLLLYWSLYNYAAHTADILTAITVIQGVENHSWGLYYHLWYSFVVSPTFVTISELCASHITDNQPRMCFRPTPTLSDVAMLHLLLSSSRFNRSLVALHNTSNCTYTGAQAPVCHHGNHIAHCYLAMISTVNLFKNRCKRKIWQRPNIDTHSIYMEQDQITFNWTHSVRRRYQTHCLPWPFC